MRESKEERGGEREGGWKKVNRKRERKQWMNSRGQGKRRSRNQSQKGKGPEKNAEEGDN